VRLRTCELLSYRCTPLHSKQKTLPKLTDAHCGFFIPQSQQTVFPGIAFTTAWSWAVICTIVLQFSEQKRELIDSRKRQTPTRRSFCFCCILSAGASARMPLRVYTRVCPCWINDTHERVAYLMLPNPVYSSRDLPWIRTDKPRSCHYDNNGHCL